MINLVVSVYPIVNFSVLYGCPAFKNYLSESKGYSIYRYHDFLISELHMSKKNPEIFSLFYQKTLTFINK